MQHRCVRGALENSLEWLEMTLVSTVFIKSDREYYFKTLQDYPDIHTLPAKKILILAVQNR